MTREELQAKISEIENELSVAEKKRSEQYSNHATAQAKAAKYEAKYYARLKRQEQLEDFPDNPVEALWCLDLTNDIPIGTEVGVVDVAGCAKYNGRNIIDGYKKNYEYDLSRDGELHHAFPGLNLNFSYLKFLTYNEGFQRWKPTTRYAVIVAWEGQAIELDYWDVQSGDRQAYIRYLPAYSAWLKNSINKYPEDQHNVPIDYMACGDKAFKINDEILVEFQETDSELSTNDGEEGWTKPLIKGFKDHPQPCPLYLYFIRDPILYYDEKGDPVDAGSKARESSARVFDVDEYLDDNLDEREPDKAVSITLPLNTNCIAGYNNTDSEHGSKSCNGHWSKTLYRTTVHALSWTILGLNPILQWGVFVEHNGEIYTFKPSEVDREQDTTLWPPEPFKNIFPCSQHTSQGSYTPNKSFDVFELEEIWDDYSWDIGDIVVIMQGRKDSCEIWNITQDDYKFKSIPIHAEIINDFPGEMNADFRVVSLGVCKNIIYIAYAKMNDERMEAFYEIYAFNLFNDTFTFAGESGDFCCYNPFTEKVWYYKIDEEITKPYNLKMYGARQTSDPLCAHGYFSECNESCIANILPERLLTTPTVTESLLGIGLACPWFPDICKEDCTDPRQYCYDNPTICYCAATNTQWTVDAARGAYSEKLEGSKTTGSYVTADYVWGVNSNDSCENHYLSDWWILQINNLITSNGVSGTVYEDWPEAVAYHASITPKGSGLRIAMTVKNGVESSESNTVQTSEKSIDCGVVENDFVLDKWPYVNPYAIAIDVTDRAGNNYDSLVAIKDINNHIIFDGDDLGEYDITGLFQFYLANLEVFTN